MREMTLLHVGAGGEGEKGGAIGYGRLGVELAKALREAGVDVFDDMNAPSHGQNHLTGQVKGRRHKMTNVACWVSTPGHARGWWLGQHPAIFTMWEATRLPEAYREHLHHFQTVIVPSEQNLELFSQFHPNVRYCPLGIDPAAWKFTPRRTPTVTFDFLIGGSGARKGTDIAYKAFLKAFPEDSWGSGPIPRLIMKSPKAEKIYHSRVSHVNGRITAEDEVALYASAHCYVQPSRGEGFGLQPLQAMAQGMPTILTDAHGHKAFSHLGYGVGSKLAPASYFIYGDAGEWWEPNLDDVVDHMREIYNHYDDAMAIGEDAAETVARDFTWARTAERFEAAFDGELERPYTGGGEWFTPTHKLYLTILNRDWTADIAGTHYYFKAGVEYYEHSDVKRIMFEAGLLDPKCLEFGQIGDNSGVLDTGLTAKEVEQIGAYTAAHSHCPTCQQPMNSRPTLADDLLVEYEAASRA